MEDQYFNPASFDLSLSGCLPMGFSPSIDGASGLPLSFGDEGLTPSFMLEVQRKRADTVSTFKPDSDLRSLSMDDHLEDAAPKRKRGLQRLSLASSIASSAPSTSASDANGGFDSESDMNSNMSPVHDVAVGPWSAAQERIHDLVHWRSSLTIQANSLEGTSPPFSNTGALHGQGSEFSFAEFIDDTVQTDAPNTDEDPALQQALESAQGMSLAPGAPLVVASDPSLPHSDVFSCVPGAELGLFDPSHHPQPSLSLVVPPHSAAHPMEAMPAYVDFAGSHSMVSPPLPSCASQPEHATAPVYSAPHCPPQEHCRIPLAVPRMVPMTPEAYHGQPMVFSRSAPARHHMPMYHAGIVASPSPSSPSFSARSSSPYLSSPLGMPPPSPLDQSPAIGSVPLSTMSAASSPIPKGMNLLGHFAHLTNPYAGLITKRSRGRRVPNKPEEMNNLGKSGKVYTCKVPGCGKCFKRSEHLKRHVRSIHTDDKPFLCPYPNCHKRFSRHDNLNQHARVHYTVANGTPSDSPHPGSLASVGVDVWVHAQPAELLEFNGDASGAKCDTDHAAILGEVAHTQAIHAIGYNIKHEDTQ